MADRAIGKQGFCGGSFPLSTVLPDASGRSFFQPIYYQSLKLKSITIIQGSKSLKLNGIVIKLAGRMPGTHELGHDVFGTGTFGDHSVELPVITPNPS